MPRTKKIAIVTTILMVGTAVALCYRKPDTTTSQQDGSRSSIGTKRSEGSNNELPRLPVRSTTRQLSESLSNTSATEPKLTGYIEPVTQSLMPVGASSAQGNPFERALQENSTPVKTQSAYVDSGSPAAVKNEAQSPRQAAAQASERVETVLGSSALAPQDARRPLDWREPNRSSENSDVERARSDEVSHGFAATAPAVKHRIVDGDTLAVLASRYLGDAIRSVDIFDYNRDLLASPELLPIGKDIRIPPHGYRRTNTSNSESVGGVGRQAELKLVPIAAADEIIQTPIQKSIQPRNNLDGARSIAALAGSNSKTYVVQRHDTLALISRKVYGDLAHQEAIIAANRPQLQTAKDLRPGMTLVLPPGTN